MNKIFKLGIVIFIIGFVGVLSTLSIDITLPEEIQNIVSELFTPWQFKLINLINPTIFLIVSVVIGTLLYEKVNLKLPIIESFVFKHQLPELSGCFKFGIIGGIISGVLIITTAVLFKPILPTEFTELGQKFKPSIVVRFLYGGLTEEILIRFGMMTFFVWLVSKVLGKLSLAVYWIGIVSSAILFGVGHLPIVYTLIDTPTNVLITYIILGNAIAGIVFGWLYWKRGLEVAMIAHVFTHLIMLIGENMFNV